MRVVKLAEAGHEAAVKGLCLSHGLWNREDLTDEEKWARAYRRAKKTAHKQGGHNKFLEQIQLWFEVQAPRYWWVEADTYRLSSKSSESTMHTLANRPLTQEDFVRPIFPGTLEKLNEHISSLQKGEWFNVQLGVVKNNLPEGFLQTRIWNMSYKTLQNIYAQRHNHRLSEWQSFLLQVIGDIDHPTYIIERAS